MTYSSRWQRHKAGKCWPFDGCSYCKQGKPAKAPPGVDLARGPRWWREQRRTIAVNVFKPVGVR